MGYGLRMRNPVCLYLNLSMQYIQVMFGMIGLKLMMNYFWLKKVRVYFYQFWRISYFEIFFQCLFQLQFGLFSLFIVSSCKLLSMNIYLKLSLSRNFAFFAEEKLIIFSWLWAEIISVIGASTRVDIVIVIMNIRVVFWVEIVYGISISSLEFVNVCFSSSTDCSSSLKESKDFIGSFILESLLSLLSLFICGLYCCIKGKIIGSFGY